MKIIESKSSYNYTFPAVSLAYFLRYPNPYARHVLATDVIDRYVDPDTNRLHTTRLHLKKTKIPWGILKLLSKGVDGPNHSAQSYILETSIIDPKEGWMDTESCNLEWTGILSVVEKQRYQRLLASEDPRIIHGTSANQKRVQTTICTKVIICSRLGQGKSISHMTSIGVEEEKRKKDLFFSLPIVGIQRTIESISIKRTQDAILKGEQGMNVVLERLRRGGIVRALEGMRQDQKAVFGPEGPST